MHYKLKFSFSMTVGGRMSLSSSTVVDIKAPGDSRPQFIQKTYKGKVEEEQEPGKEIVQVTFLDYILYIRAIKCLYFHIQYVT